MDPLIKLLVNKYYKGKRFYALMDEIHNPSLPVDISFDLFDQLVLPVCLYGCEEWGFGNIVQTEILFKK